MRTRAEFRGLRLFALFAALLAFSSTLPRLARAASPASLDALLARVSDSRSSPEAKHEAFLEILFGIDALVNASPRESAPVLSHCAGFAFLYSTLYQLNGGRIEPTLEDAALFLGTTPVIYGTMVHDSRLLRGPLAPIRNQLARVLTASYNRGGAHAATPAEFFATIRNEQSADSRFNESWHEFQNAAVARLAGHEGAHVELPLWLTTHSGVSLKSSARPDLDRQGPSWGYLQKPGDDDATGRHDHLIGTMMLGYAAERARMDKLGITDSGAKVCTTPPRDRLQRLEENALRVTRWIDSRPRAAFNTVRPANWLYTILRDAAPYAEEYLAPGQNSSPSDAAVNSHGQALGARLARPNKALTASEFNTKVYQAICDEKAITPELEGPVNADALRTEFNSKAPTVTLPWQ